MIKAAAGPEGRASIAREAAAYAALARDEVLKELIPPLVHHDPATGTLVLERIPRAAEPAGPDAGPPAFTRPEVARWLGRALGLLHDRTRVDGASAPAPAAAPWLAHLDRPPLALACELPPPALRVVGLVQGEPGFARGLAALREGWAPVCVCHMDLRADNVVIPADGGGARLVDWESAAVGDPAWDLGWALAAHLSPWIDSMPSESALPAAEMVAGARYPLSRVTSSASAVWRAYGEAPGSGHPPVAHVSRCAAARLLAAAIERIDAAGSMTRAATLHVQLAARMLERPEAAARDLLGIP